MDQCSIGKFIAQCRKEKGLTQLQLADILSITDRAVSKWENGKAMPDSSIMLELCNALDITVNDLLNGEKVSSEDYNKKLEEQLIETLSEKETTDKQLFLVSRVFSVVLGIILLFTGFLAKDVPLLLYIVLTIAAYISLPFIMKGIRISGYYQCEQCGHTFIPTAKAFIWAPTTFAWKPRLKFHCPCCGKKVYHKKVFRK